VEDYAVNRRKEKVAILSNRSESDQCTAPPSRNQEPRLTGKEKTKVKVDH
jgi:hypothetical protein